MVKFVEYIDVKIRIKLPKQLRQDRHGLFFRGNLVRGKPETMVAVAIDLDLDAQSVKAIKETFLDKGTDQPVTLPKGYKVERSGQCDFGENCLELFTSSEIFDKGYTLYVWGVLYRLKGCYLMLDIMGGGTHESFESMASEIIKSLKLLSPSQAKKLRGTARSSRIKSVKFGSMRAKEKARLARELKSLPQKLKYLREPILAIADEDQDLLGCGEADTTLLVEALHRQAASKTSDFASDHSGQLEKWLKGITNTDETWAGPIWFVMAFMMGYDMYVDNQQR